MEALRFVISDRSVAIRLPAMGRRSREEAGRTRERIVGTAVAVASTDGLEGLTIGRLASEVGLSKSGLLGHFPSKEELQLAAYERASEIFTREVWARVEHLEPGIERLRTLAEAWISYLEREVFPGGCFFAAAAAELDDRPGIVRDRLAKGQSRWHKVVAREARAAGLDGEQTAFELNAFILAANSAHRLHGDTGAFARARAAVARLLGESRERGAGR
jgi:AcrR family transcriptional regulator